MGLLQTILLTVALQGAPQDTMTQDCRSQQLVEEIFVEHVEWFDAKFGHGETLRARYGYHIKGLKNVRADESMYALFEDTKRCAVRKAEKYDLMDEYEPALFYEMNWYLFDQGWILDYDLNDGDRISGVVMGGRHILIMRGFQNKPQTVVHEIFHIFFPGLWHSDDFYTMLKECIPEVW
jgi:hypothetical protein